MPLVTVIIPTYNQADFLREALQSVVNQTITDWEAIIINNFSSDHTIDVVMEFKDDRIQLINFANSGVIGASRNKGIQKAKSTWIAFLDSDDIWYPEKLEHCLKDTSEVDVIAHRLEMIKDNSVIGKSAIVTASDFYYKKLIFARNCLTPTATIVRRKLLDKVGGFSEDKDKVTAEDFELWLKLSRDKARFRFHRKVMTKYRLHDSNNSGTIVCHMNATLSVIKKHYNLLKNKTVLDYILYRRIRAIQYYGAGRKFQKKGDRKNALQYFYKCFTRYSFYIKNYIAIIQLLFKQNF